MKKPKFHVTDHALVRYLQHVHGVDIETLRRRVGRNLQIELPDELPDPCGVVVAGIEYRIADGKVVTLYPRSRSGAK